MRIGIIGPSSSVQSVLTEATASSLPVVCVPLVYNSYEESVALVEKNRDKVDAFLFSGASPYHYALGHIQPKELWDFMPRSVNSLLCAMLKAVYTEGCNIKRISMDSYDEELLRLAYAEIGLSAQDVTILSQQFRPTAPAYIDRLIAFHCDNLRNNRAEFCLTGIQQVYTAVRAANLPATKVFATSEMIVQQLQKMYLQHALKSNDKNNLAVISVQVSFAKEQSLYGRSDLQFHTDRTKTLNEVYAFAQSIGAAVEVEGNERCRLYITEYRLESVSKLFSEMPLLRELQRLDEVMLVAIGIGLGRLPAEAKYHADLARDRALKARRSCFFIIYADNRIVGPIVDASRRKQSVVVDRTLHNISAKTGIGLDRLHHLERILRRNGLETATPNELASLCGLSLCTMNRLLVKLEKSGFIRVVGKKASLPLGRPSRLVQFLF